MDISEPKSRTFNMYLRYFQMGLQVIIAAKLAEINSAACQQTFQKVGFYTAVLLVFINLIAMIVTRCSHHFPRVFFFIMFVVNLLLAGVIVVLGIVGLAEYNSCANNRVLHRFVIMEGMISVVLAFMVILLPFHWIQRYSNTPGNIAWIFIFFGFEWAAKYRLPMLIEGIICAAISLMSLLVNVFACRGITTQMKKLIVIQWIFALILMIVGQILAIVIYLQDMKDQDFMGVIANKSLQTFICVNILDMMFWLWGYMTLEYENGDRIRDELMRGTGDNQFSEEVEPYYMREENPAPAYGTIKH